MKRRKIMVGIILALLFSIFSYLFYVRFDEIVEVFTIILDKYTKKEIIIPSESKNNKDYSFSGFEITDNFIPNNIDDVKNIFYTVLNNGWDTFTFYCPKEYLNCAYDVKTIANESEFISIINNYVSPYNSYKKYNTLIIGSDEILLTVEKLYTNEEIEALNQTIDKIITDLKIDKNNIDKESIKKIHDYLVKLISYDENYVEGDIYTISNKANGALINKVALCSGYTDAFALFMDRLDIKNFKVSTDNHIWNVIYFNNEWLHVDVTWDDDEVNYNNNYNFFLINTNDLFEKDLSEHSFNIELYAELN